MKRRRELVSALERRQSLFRRAGAVGQEGRPGAHGSDPVRPPPMSCAAARLRRRPSCRTRPRSCSICLAVPARSAAARACARPRSVSGAAGTMLPPPEPVFRKFEQAKSAGLTVLIDSHCHLDFPELAADRAGVLARASGNGVDGMVTISTRVRAVRRDHAPSPRQNAQVWCSVGTHPAPRARGTATSRRPTSCA